MCSTKLQWALSNLIPFRSLPAYPIFQDKLQDQNLRETTNHAQQSITLKIAALQNQLKVKQKFALNQLSNWINHSVVLLNYLKKTVKQLREEQIKF